MIGIPAGRIRTIEAGSLNGTHIGKELLAPGMVVEGAWQVTWAPITLIQFKKDGAVKVRRHPDGHTDHTFQPTDLVQVAFDSDQAAEDPFARVTTFRDSEDGDDSLEAALEDAVDDAIHDTTSPYTTEARIRHAIDKTLDARRVADPDHV